MLTLSPDALTDKNLYIYCDNNPVMRVDEEGDAWHGLIGFAVGAVAGFVGQVVSDVVTSVVSGEIAISNWQTYAGSIVGGGVGGLVLATTGNVEAASAASSFAATGLGQALEKIFTTDDYDKSWAEIGASAVVDGCIGYAFGKLPGAKGVTKGRNSMSAVYRSGLTKIRNGNAMRMSVKVIGKGLLSSIVDDVYMDIYQGFNSAASNRAYRR